MCNVTEIEMSGRVVSSSVEMRCYDSLKMSPCAFLWNELAVVFWLLPYISKELTYLIRRAGYIGKS